MSLTDKVIIYTNEQCPYCKQVKEELTKNNIEFENRFTKDFEDQWKSISSLTGMPTVPTIYYKDDYLVTGRDFPNPTMLVTILKNYDSLSLSFSHARQALERVRTLNYTMSMAFNRLDQLLRQIETKINTDEHKSTD